MLHLFSFLYFTFKITSGKQTQHAVPISHNFVQAESFSLFTKNTTRVKATAKKDSSSS